MITKGIGFVWNWWSNPPLLNITMHAIQLVIGIKCILAVNINTVHYIVLSDRSFWWCIQINLIYHTHWSYNEVLVIYLEEGTFLNSETVVHPVHPIKAGRNLWVDCYVSTKWSYFGSESSICAATLFFFRKKTLKWNLSKGYIPTSSWYWHYDV